MAPLVVAVTPNGSVDTVLRALGPAGSEEQEVELVAETAGGKGHNVARFLAAAGVPTLACGFAGGQAGEELRSLLETAGVRPSLTAIDTTTRRYATLVGPGRERLSYRMAGPRVTASDAARLLSDVVSASATASHVVLAGSLPPGAPADLYGQIAAAVGPTKVWLDTSGDALAGGIGARPAVVKLNQEELAGLGVRSPATSDLGTWRPVLDELARRTGIGEWWVTLGPAGAVGWVDGRAIAVTAPEVVAVNTTGAGDAFLAGLLTGRLRGRPVLDSAIDAAAVAAALCEQEAPLPPDPDRVAELRDRVIAR